MWWGRSAKSKQSADDLFCKDREKEEGTWKATYVVSGSQSTVGSTDLAAGVLQTLKSLRRGHLVDQVSVCKKIVWSATKTDKAEIEVWKY